MKPYALLIDDFFDDFAAVRTYLDEAKFVECSVEFAGDPFRVEHKLGQIFGCRIGLQEVTARFIDRNTPHKYGVHSAAFTGAQYVALIYLNRPEHVQPWAAEVLCRREAIGGIETSIAAPEEIPFSEVDGHWQTVLNCELKSNRAFIFPADRLRYSSPHGGGFGVDQKDARMTLTVLFSLAGLTT